MSIEEVTKTKEWINFVSEIKKHNDDTDTLDGPRKIRSEGERLQAICNNQLITDWVNMALVEVCNHRPVYIGREGECNGTL